MHHCCVSIKWLVICHLLLWYSVDDDLYVIAAGLFGSPDIFALTGDFFRDKGSLFNDIEMNRILRRWRKTHLLQLETITNTYLQVGLFVGWFAINTGLVCRKLY